MSREEELRRERAREREERDKMVRDYIRYTSYHHHHHHGHGHDDGDDDSDDLMITYSARNGRGWSQPEVARRMFMFMIMIINEAGK